jgi:hypothetical protein
MGQFIATSYFKQQILADLVESVTAGDYDGVLVPANVSVGLITGTPIITQDTALADLTQPAFGGYAITPMTSWGITRRDNSGNYSKLGNSIAFNCTGTPHSDVVTGAFLVDNTTTPDTLLGVQMFDTPVNITAIGNGLNYSPEVLLAFDLTTGEGCLC